MGQGRVLARGDDRRERGAGGAELAHPLLGGQLDLALGPAAPSPARRSTRRPRRPARRRPRYGSAPRRSFCGEARPAGPRPRRARRPRRRPRRACAGRGRWCWPRRSRRGRAAAWRARPAPGPRPDPVEGRIDLALGALGVAEVGEEQSLLGRDHAERAGAGEAGQPEDVGLCLAPRVAGVTRSRDDQLVEALGSATSPASRSAAAHPASSPFSSSSASR